MAQFRDRGVPSRVEALTGAALSRREFMALGLGGTAAAMLAACTPGAPTPREPGSTPTPASGQPKPKLATSFRYATQAIASTMDPHGSHSISGYQALRQVHDTLLTFDETGEQVIGHLAHSYRMVDARTIELELRDDIRFSDGEPLTAEVVKWNIDRPWLYEDPTTLASRRRWGSAQPEIEIINSSRLRMKVEAPDALLPNRLATYFITSQRHGEAQDGNLVEGGVGTGPFRVTRFVPNSVTEYEAWDGSWRGAPTVQTASYIQIPEAAGLVAALQTGEVDAIYSPPPDQIATLREAFTLTTVPSGACTVVNMLPEFSPLDQARVREAFNLAVDKEQLLESVFGGFGRVAGQFIEPGFFGHDPAIEPFPYDPERARSLLRDAGVTSLELEIVAVAPTRTIAEVIAGFLGDVGVTAQVNLIEFPRFVDAVVNGSEWPMYPIRADYFSLRDFDAIVGQYARPADRQSTYNNAEFNRLANAQRQEIDPDRRRELVGEAVRIAREDPPVIFLAWQDFPIVHTPSIAELPIANNFFVDFEKVEKLA